MGFLFQLFFFFFFHYNMPGDFSTIEKEAKEKRSTHYISILEKKCKKKLSTISKTNNTHQKKKKRRDKWTLLTQGGSHTIWELELFSLGLSRGVYLVASFHSTPKSWPRKSIKSKRAFCIKTRITSKQFAMWKFPLMILFWFCHSNASNAFHAFLAINSMRSNGIWVWPLLLLLHKSAFLCMTFFLSLRLFLFVH